MDRHPDGTAVGEVDQVERDINTASLSARSATASVLLHCRSTNGCKWSVPCVHSMRQARRPYYFAQWACWETWHRGKLQTESRMEEALDSIKALLGCGGHDGGAGDVRLLFAASKALPRHSMLWTHALRSRELEPAITALLDPCVRADATYKDKALVSQMALMQPKLQCMCNTFWQALAKHSTTAL
jgi:hypothetical protein